MPDRSTETLLRTETMLKTAMGQTVASALADPAVIEIMLNPDGQLWIERHGQGRINSGETMQPSEAERVIIETDKALDLFANVLPSARFLSDDETLTYLQSCVSPKRHSVNAPETPAYLDAVLGGADLIGGLEPVLGGEHLRIISVQGFPSATEPGLLDELNSLGFSYRWMTRFLPMGI